MTLAAILGARGLAAKPLAARTDQTAIFCFLQIDHRRREKWQPVAGHHRVWQSTLYWQEEWRQGYAFEIF
jgi:hypothetical protein